jgi:hypothetical protein
MTNGTWGLGLAVNRRNWDPIIDEARRIVAGYPYQITLRQLHYRLVSTPGLGYRNVEGDYNYLSEKTAELRRLMSFPDLRDDTRRIEQAPFWASPATALKDLAEQYRRDRTEGQPNQVYLAGEKATLLAQLEDWFDQLGLPILLLRGHTSQTFAGKVIDAVEADERPAVLIYAGDLDPSGDDILRDFVERTDVWDEVERIAVTEQLVNDLGLPMNAGKPADSRAKRFLTEHPGLGLVQVELEAVPPGDLRRLYSEAIERWHFLDPYEQVIAAEQAERQRLEALAEAES